MSVAIQSTPNPNARKFVLPTKLFAKPLSFASGVDAAAHPLAAQLFALGTIYNVFMVQDFITINKLPDADWEPLEAAALSIITDYLEQL
ncbi:MAG: NifU N-terminal domain-containing protein [Caldilineaceae bacterium]|nr:NifU N-terminal domain-containing protein [Caldilineaceae bacterium]